MTDPDSNPRPTPPGEGGRTQAPSPSVHESAAHESAAHESAAHESAAHEAGDFDSVLAALGQVRLATPACGWGASLEAALATASSLPSLDSDPESLEQAILRDADEAWSLALTSLSDAERAWDSIVAGFALLSAAERPWTPELSLGLQARAALSAHSDVPARHKAAGASSLSPNQRMELLLRGGLGLTGDLHGFPATPDATHELRRALVAGAPQSCGEALGLLVAGEVLGSLSSSEREELVQLREAHPLSAALVGDHYRELAEVPPHVLARRDELLAAVQVRLGAPLREASDVAAAGPPPALPPTALLPTALAPTALAPTALAPLSSAEHSPPAAPPLRVLPLEPGAERSVGRKARQNLPVLVGSLAALLTLSGAVGLIVWRTQSTDQRHLELAQANEWSAMQAAYQARCKDARVGLKASEARLASFDPQGAQGILQGVERTLAGLTDLTTDYNEFTSPAAVRAFLAAREPELVALRRAVCLQRGRALLSEGTPSALARAETVLAAGLRDLCHEPTLAPEPLAPAEHGLRAALRAELMHDRIALQLASGRVQARRGRLSEARATFSGLLQRNPELNAARLELGGLLEREGKLLEAIATYGDVLQRDARSVQALLARGRLRTRLALYESSIEDFDAAIRVDDMSYEAFVFKGCAEQALGRFDEAVENLTEAIDITPSLSLAYLRRADLYFAQRKLPRALKDYEVALERGGADLDSRLGLARALEWSLDYAGAKSRYAEVLSEERASAADRALARGGLGRLALAQAAPLQATYRVEERARGLQGTQPRQWLPAERLRDESAALVEEHLALARTQLAPTADEAQPSVHLPRFDQPPYEPPALARARLALRDRDLPRLQAAVRALLSHLDTLPPERIPSAPAAAPDADAWGDEDAWADEDASRPQGAEAFARRGWTRAQGLALLGLASLQADEPQDARGHFRAALGADPLSSLAKAGLATTFLPSQPERASELFAEARVLGELENDEAGHFFSRGLRHAHLAARSKSSRFYSLARRAFARVRLVDPLHARSYLEEAKLCLIWRDLDAAVFAAKAAVRCDPFLADAQQVLGFLFTRELPLARHPRTQRPLELRDATRGKAAFTRALELAPPSEKAGAYHGRALASLTLASQGEPGTSLALLKAARRDLDQALAAAPTDARQAEPRALAQLQAYLQTYAQVCESLEDTQGSRETMIRLDALRVRILAASAEELQAGRNLRDRLNYSEAIKHFDRALELHPTSSEALYDRGSCYLKIGNFIPGVLDYSRALELDPRIGDEVYNSVYQISYVVDLNRVISELNKVVSDHPDASYVVFLRGFFYVAKTEFKTLDDADIKAGIADFDRCLELNPKHVTAHLYRGLLWQKAAQRSPALPPRTRDEWSLEGSPPRLSPRQQAYARSLADYVQALKLDPKSGISHYLQSLHWSVRSSEPGLEADVAEARRLRAVDELRAALAEDFRGYERIRNEAGFDAIRTRPDFKELLGKN